MELVPLTHKYGYKTDLVPSCVVSNHAWPPPTTMVERRADLEQLESATSSISLF